MKLIVTSRRILKSSILLIVLFSTGLAAKENDLAIIHATVYSATERGVIKNANITVNNGLITAISQGLAASKSINAKKIIDAENRIVTPGFIGVMNSLGLSEVNSEGTTQDAKDGKLGINFDPSLAFNSKSSLLPFARKGGITYNISSPATSNQLFAGQTFAVNLSGELSSVEHAKNGVVVKLGRESRGSRATKLQLLMQKLAATKKLAAAKHDAEQKVLAQVLAQQKPLLVYADRASDLLKLIELKNTFNFNLVIVGAGDAIVVKESLAAANIPIIFNPMVNLPSNFDNLHQSISDAGILHKAGVKLIFRGISGHYLEQLRFSAGNAAANGMDYQAALAAITANTAEVFSLNTGSVAVGKKADVVLWYGNPLDIDGHVEGMWINGIEVSTYSRQDSLRDRYLSKQKMPAAYNP